MMRDVLLSLVLAVLILGVSLLYDHLTRGRRERNAPFERLKDRVGAPK